MKTQEKIRRFLAEHSVEMLDDKIYKNGTAYFLNLGNGLSVVLCWEEGYTPDEKNMFSKKVGDSGEADNLVASIRFTEPISQWGNHPSDWMYASECSFCSLGTSDYKDRMSSIANYLTEVVESMEDELCEKHDLETVIWE